MTYQLFPIAGATRTQAETISDQRDPVIASLADGGAVVVWVNQPDADDSSTHELLAQRYDAAGNSVGALETIYSSSSSRSSSINPVVTGLEDGGYAIAWRDAEAANMRVRTFDAAGQDLSDRILALPDRQISETQSVEVNGLAGGYGGSTITALEGGGFAVTWEAGYSGILAQYIGAQTLYSAIFGAQGNLTTAPFQVSPWIGTGSYSYDRWNGVYDSTGLADGTYAIVTRIGETTDGNDSGFPSVGIQIRGPEGALLRDAYLVSSAPDEPMGSPAVATLRDGSFVVAWNSSTETLWRRFDADGTPQGGDVSLGALYDRPSVSAVEDGGFLIGLRSKSGYNPSFESYAFRFDETGAQVGERLQMHTRGDFEINYIQVTPEFVSLGDGSLLALWSGHASWNGDDADVLIRRFMAERIGTEAGDTLTAAETSTALFGREGDDSLTGSGANDVLFGDAGADTLRGRGGDDTIAGGADGDDISGDDGNDLLDGAEGDDTVSGGAGDDTVTVGSGDDVVSGGDGTDLLVVGAPSVALVVRGPEDRLVLTTEAGTITTSGFETFEFSDETTLDLPTLLALRNQTIRGTSGADDLTGGYGDDLIEGLQGDDLLAGAEGNDTLISGSGNNTLLGGAGDDVLRIEGSGLRVIDSATVNPLTQPLALGRDWSLLETPDIENATTRPHQTLEITGSGDREEAFTFQAKAGQTWVFDIDGASFDTYLTLLRADGTAITWDDDSATGLGGAGSTSGRDSFIEHQFDADGTYTISLSAYGGSVLSETSTATLNISVEGGFGPEFTVDGANTADGGAGDDRLIGGSGNDTLTGGDGVDVAVLAADSRAIAVAAAEGGLLVTSAAGADFIADDIETIAFDDRTLSYADLDAQVGSAANRVFQFTLDGTQPTTPTGSAGSGVGYAVFDAVAGTLSYSVTVASLANITNAHIHAGARGVDGGVVFGFLSDDDLSATFNRDGSVTATGIWDGAEGIEAFLPALAQSAPGSDLDLYVNIHTAAFPGGEIRGQLVSSADDTANAITGTGANETLDGLGGDDVLLGGGGDDLIRGGAGNDTMTGGPGADTVEGGAGDDVYIVDDSADRIVETAGEGFDEVRTTVDLSIGGASIERLSAAGPNGVRLTGNGEANELVGHDGRDTLIGAGGYDTMTGGAGDDFFVLLGSSSTIEVTDFARGDKLVLDDRLLGLGDGSIDIRALAPEVALGLLLDGTAGFAPRTGTLLLDLDGSGPEGLQPVVTLGPDASLGIDDILIF
ncbi:CHRD domain-containing protein [Jannaschia seohaensis]|uniref:Hemolysin type calcium-binding protein n=1 Tax=Jannaschia seohaensis TaxID=475081 RepID=A0A2Y9BZH2_9RHOB|nr:CHRD domain-containing protein [Jannaschia seohaensis]PWJ20309.1 hemolysin type calcium-binding protein [Jannaschia seohaensis]SSA44342.1 Hemolysin-type calcium-binding repeat-containing protein [Jannaschia seohaensis]